MEETEVPIPQTAEERASHVLSVFMKENLRIDLSDPTVIEILGRNGGQEFHEFLVGTNIQVYGIPSVRYDKMMLVGMSEMYLASNKFTVLFRRLFLRGNPSSDEVDFGEAIKTFVQSMSEEQARNMIINILVIPPNFVSRRTKRAPPSSQGEKDVREWSPEGETTEHKMETERYTKHAYQQLTGDRVYKELDVLKRCTQLTTAVILCANCGKPVAKLACSACQLTFYCSKECQTKHWEDVHETECGLVSMFRYLNVGVQRSDYYRIFSGGGGPTNPDPRNPRIHQLTEQQKTYVVTNFRGKDDPKLRKLWFEGVRMFWVEPVKAGKPGSPRLYFIVGRDVYFLARYGESFNSVMVAYAMFIANVGDAVSQEIYREFGSRRPSQYFDRPASALPAFPSVPKKK
jgi:hypothetical protein